MKMNLPNKLTMFRIALIPVFLIILYINSGNGATNWVAFAIFCVASATDAVDGYIARKYNLITDFGKFMDPLADKLLVCSALIALTDLGRIFGWIVIIIIAREFIISGFRLVAAGRGKVIAAGKWGKIKTIVQMIATMLLIIDFKNIPMIVITQIFVYAALVLTVISLIDYFINNKEVLNGGN